MFGNAINNVIVKVFYNKKYIKIIYFLILLYQNYKKIYKN